MKFFVLSVLALWVSSTPAFAAGGARPELVGMLQYERPCVIAGNPNGCLRVISSSGGLFYLQREDHAPSAEFVIEGFPQLSEVKLFRVFFTDLKSALLVHNQAVRVIGKIETFGDELSAGGTILRVDRIEVTGTLND